MNVNRIGQSLLPKLNLKKTKVENKKEESNLQLPINKKRVGAAILAGLMLTSLNSAVKPSTAQAETTYTGKSYIDTINPEDISYSIQPLNGAYIEQTDFSTPFLPVAEFYLPNEPDEIILNINEDVPLNKNGNAIFDITISSSPKMGEAATIGEIIDKTYSDVLAGYDEETRGNVRNKIIDEIVQANPAVSDYIATKQPSETDSYEEIETMNLSPSGIEFVSIPNIVVYQSQEDEIGRLSFSQFTYTHKPEMEMASVVGNSSYLLEGEYETLPDLIYGVYGDDISTEAYRDILYAVVNSPENAEYFENVINDMNINEIMQSGSITDINRTLEENTSGVMLNLTMPTVNTTRVVPNGYDIVGGKKEDIIYQISPAKVGSNDAERSILLSSKGDSAKQSGDVYDLVDVLQFYASPDGNGRFAEVDRNGWLILNDDISYFNPFATQIMQQVVYANLDIFTAPYEDESGVHPYGVFDVNNGYDVEGKTLEEIIENSTINTDRMNDFSFIDENGNCLFEQGVRLNLPQFNYRINYCEQSLDEVETPTNPPPSNPPEETQPPTGSCEPTPTVPLETENPPEIPPPTITTTPPPETEVPPVIESGTDVPVDEPIETEEPTDDCEPTPVVPNQTEDVPEIPPPTLTTAPPPETEIPPVPPSGTDVTVEQPEETEPPKQTETCPSTESIVIVPEEQPTIETQSVETAPPKQEKSQAQK